MIEPEKMNLESMDVAQEKRKQLKTLFPEAFAEDKVDFDQLKRALGEWVEPATQERFGLNWPGKAECMKIVQQPSVATLKPARKESVNFDCTENLFIEGDNLEVLKLLQKSYFGKVKMIYIDPPYNTGNEFIYPDKYSETLDTYLEYTGQKDGNGHKFSTNVETNGRYHSNWLNMMYPRLYLARNLLREDGVIFISIDDNEQANLRELCDQIFGEENFVTNITWRRTKNKSNLGKGFANVIDHLICYSKNKSELSLNKVSSENTGYNYEDVKGKYSRNTLIDKKRGAHDYNVTTPSGRTINGPWITREEEFYTLLDNDRIHWSNGKNETPYKKIYLHETKGLSLPDNFWDSKIYGSNQDGSFELEKLFGKVRIFDFPKPTKLLNWILRISTNSNDLILDFFAGSCTTAHAVMALNKEDGGNRKFICVQLPEPCDKKSEAFKAGYKTIADIGKERIRLAIGNMKKERNGQLALSGSGNLDLGFKVFKLDKSNFKIWEGNIEKIENLEQQLLSHVDHINDASEPEDILYELLLKAGFPLTTPAKKITMASKSVFSIQDGAMLICLDKELNQAVVDAMAETNPLQVICLDEGFQGNDQLKANTVQTFKALSREKESEIVFKTV